MNQFALFSESETPAGVENKTPKSVKKPKVDKPKGCDSCPFKGRTVVKGSGDIKTARLVVALGMPGPDESRTQIPLSNTSGRVLWSELGKFGLNKNNCYVTYICKCRGDRNKENTADVIPNSKIRLCCHDQFADEWEQIKGKPILSVGAMASKALTGKAGKNIWGFISKSYTGDTVLSVRSPSYMMSINANYRPIWLKHLSLVTSILEKKEVPDINWLKVSTPTEFERMVEYFLNVSPEPDFAFDLETTGLYPWAKNSRILTMAVSDGYRTYGVDMDSLGNSIDAHLKILMESTKGKIAHNFKFDVSWLWRKKGILTKSITFDPAIARYLLDEGTGSSVRLKQIVYRYFKEYGGYESDVEISDLEHADRDKVLLYNCTDAFLTFKIARILAVELRDAGMEFVFNSVILPSVYPLAEMETFGLKIDFPKLEQRRSETLARIAELKKEIWKLPQVKEIEDFSINSLPKMRALFYDKLKLKPKKILKKSKAPALTKEDLQEWADKGIKAAKLIAEIKKALKLVSTYYDNYKNLADEDGFLHPGYNMMLARGGRLTSVNPNIQNVPKDTREVFCSRFENGVLLNMDFKAIEMRVVAIIANDEALLDIFRTGKDPHFGTASQVLGIPIEQVTKKQRQLAKAVNFGLVYGMKPETLAMREKMPAQTAKEFYDGYFNKFSGVKRWQAEMRIKANNNEKIFTLFGRRRDISSFTGEDKIKRAYNTPVQGTAADINLYALGLIWELIRLKNLRTKFVATVHDSLVLDCPPDEVDEVKNILTTAVDSLPSMFPWMSIPMEIDIATASNWKDAC